MKITKLITVETEVEVHVSCEDIASAINEPGVDRLFAVQSGLNNVGAYLKAIPDDLIVEMTDGQKQTVAKFLHDQAHRFMPNTPS